MGTISDIKNILRELCQGQYEFTTAMIIRETMFLILSVMVLNAETWHEITKDNIEELELSDRTLLKRILEVPESTPNVSLYLEFGIVPVRFLIQAKRILFLHYLLNRPKEEMMKKVLKAQEKKPI